MMLAGGASAVAVGRKFGVTHDAVTRHWNRHVSQERKAQIIAGPIKLHQLAERAAAEGMSLLDYLALIRSTLLSQFSAAAEAGDKHGTATLAGRLLECLREIGRLTGELSRVGGVNVTNNTLILGSPFVAELQSMLIQTLAPFPDARAAVITGMRALEQRAMGVTPPQIEGEAAHAA